MPYLKCALDIAAGSHSVIMSGSHKNKCRCTLDQQLRYKAKMSGSLLNRINLDIKVPALKEDELTKASVREHSQPIDLV